MWLLAMDSQKAGPVDRQPWLTDLLPLTDEQLARKKILIKGKTFSSVKYPLMSLPSSNVNFVVFGHTHDPR